MRNITDIKCNEYNTFIITKEGKINIWGYYPVKNILSVINNIDNNFPAFNVNISCNWNNQ